ncbi:DNA translocase FtsK [Weissella confusa]|uniref:DNA translocase FtsK n=1 Tax=Weissella confusa TaxID=1583 RepID=UPI00189D41D3|nr:DNA translocase FtsK [Weissella confusa]MBF7058697.1 DNA translocase FtsK [Weissella confusa]
MAATAKKRPTTKRKTTPKKSTSAKKKKAAQQNWWLERGPQLIGLFATIMTVIAIAKVGLVGKFLANIIRLVVGGSYQFFLLVLLIPLLVVVAYGQWPKRFKWQQYVGFTLFYLGVMLVGSILLFDKMNVHEAYAQTIQTLINQDMNNKAVTTPVGGGLIGALMYSGTYMAMADFGSWLVAVILLIAGPVMFFNLPIRDVFDNFFNLAEGAGDLVQTQASTAHEKVTESIESFRVRQKSAMQEFFNEDPFASEAERAAQMMDGLPDASASNDAPITSKKAKTPTAAVEAEPEVDATATEFVMPEIVAPAPFKPEAPVDEATFAAAEPVTNEFTPLPSEDEAPVEMTYDPSFNPDAVIQAQDAAIEPVVYGEDLPDDELLPGQDVPLTHADILGHNDAQTSPKTTAHQSNVGHVEPSTISEPTADVDASCLGTLIDDKDYILPTTDLLQHIGSTDQSAERDALNDKARILHETLKSFNINATVEKVVLGPTVTQYEIKPAVGVKVSKIQNLADDLALALAAKSLRIEAPIPGKNVVGIEVANDQQATVGFRDMVEEAGIDTTKPLVVPIGRGVTSGVVKLDLTKMPHLLIAGSTGSGKSVAINGILASILLQAKPSQVRLMLVDPKKVELSVYNDIPHLITPVISDPKKASLGLKKVVSEMDRRFKLLADEGVRNIDGYNRLVEKRNAADPSTVLQKMPYLVVIIDELADLMMTSAVSGDVENSIVRIAQLGRAAGIHMIVATQRPSVDIITGLIKANVPSRMAFAVSSGVDSRTILDSNGAEKLLGRGDMLFAPIGSNGPQRVQGAFLTDEDVESLTDFIKNQGEAQYDKSMEVSDEEVNAIDNPGSEGDELDERWDDVLEFILRAGGASTSSIQRHFGMGYNRAGRIMDALTDRGLIGEQNGSKPRELKFTPEMLDRFRREALK